MAQLLVRNVPEDVVDALKRRAAEHGRSTEAEHRAILQDAVRPGRAAFIDDVRRLRAASRGKIDVESWKLIREDRDQR